MSQKTLVLFDFDGTITTKDTLFEFLKFQGGSRKFYLKMMALTPIFWLYFLKLLSAQQLKEKLLFSFLKNKQQATLKKTATSFIDYLTNKQIIKPDFITLINDYKQKGSTLAVVSASPDLWIDVFCERHQLISICTKMEFINEHFSGNFLSPNCNGEEKLIRIKNEFEITAYNKIITYGNSKGDREMFSIAHEGIWV